MHQITEHTRDATGLVRGELRHTPRAALPTSTVMVALLVAVAVVLALVAGAALTTPAEPIISAPIRL